MLQGWPASDRTFLTFQAHGKGSLHCFTQVMPGDGILIGIPSVVCLISEADDPKMI